MTPLESALALGFLPSLGRERFIVGNAHAETQAVFKLPDLGYPFEALEPHIDSQTLHLHHDRHHAAAVAGLNVLVEKYPDLAKKSAVAILSELDKVQEAVRAGVRNNLGSHWNHSFYWDIMTPGGAKEAAGDLRSAIDAAFGSVANMMDKVNAAGVTRLGSGWAWLVVDKRGELQAISTQNQDTPLEQGVRRVVLAVDVWEHAYYLKYQNKRSDYLKAWWNTVNWDKAASNFARAPA
ncbi:MAG: superoxide dismutase [Alphaproteobacteria bacterium]|nr:superoxide dismutase [Alphaproteobacteria bacterium]MBM3641680.1 superoxide dismutase [Alphaproteobacteria bacterium]